MPRAPFGLNIGLLVPGMITIPLECGEHIGWREIRPIVGRGQAGARAHLSDINIETGVLTLCPGGEPPNTFLHRVPRKHREEQGFCSK